MKSEKEIREKIDEYMEHLEEHSEDEPYLCIIDVLLWVVGDESGKPI